MPSFLAATQCSGQRPKGLLFKRHFARPHLIAQLLQERRVPRYIVAPPCFGKTLVAYEYASTVFSFHHVFWIDGKSPCFLRDLDAQVIAQTLLDLDSESFLVVIEDVPRLDSDRVQTFLSLIDYLLKKGAEVIITCTPSNDSFEAHRDRLKVSAYDLLLTSEEEKSVLCSCDRWSSPRSISHQAYRIPSLAWGDDRAIEVFLAAAARENAPSELLCALFLLLALQSGGRSELERLSLSNNELLANLSQNYPYVDLDLSTESFSAAPFSLEMVLKAFLPVLSKEFSHTPSRYRDEMGRVVADMLIKRGENERACLLVRFLLTRSDRAVWLAEKGKHLFEQSCIEPAHMVYASLGEERAGLSSYLQAGEVLRCYAIGETAWSYKTALKLFGLRSAPHEVRALMGLILAREQQLTNPEQLKTWSALIAHESLNYSRRLETSFNENPLKESSHSDIQAKQYSLQAFDSLSSPLLGQGNIVHETTDRSLDQTFEKETESHSAGLQLYCGQEQLVSDTFSLVATNKASRNGLSGSIPDGGDSPVFEETSPHDSEMVSEYHLTSLSELLVSLAVHEGLKTSLEKACSVWCRAVQSGARGNMVFLSALWILEEGLSEIESQEDYARECPPCLEEYLTQLKQTLLEENPCTCMLYAARVGALAQRAYQNNLIPHFELPTCTVLKFREIELSLFEQRALYLEELADEAERKRVWNETHPSFVRRATSWESIPSMVKTTPLLTVNLFGGLEVFIGSERVDPHLFRRQKVKTLLALLVLNKGREYSRDKLIELLWPEGDRESSRKNFYSVWSLLRQALTTPEGTCPYLIRQQQSLRIEGSLLRSDVQQLDEICRKLLFEQPDYGGWANLFAQVSEVFSDEILPSDCDNAALEGRRRECRDRLVDALVSASLRLVRAGECREGLWFARAAMQRDDEREDVYTALMEAQIESGQRAAALETYFACRKFLSNELGIDPAANTVRLYQSIIEVDEVYR